MSRKVSKYIRAQRKAKKQAEREMRRAAAQPPETSQELGTGQESSELENSGQPQNIRHSQEAEQSQNAERSQNAGQPQEHLQDDGSTSWGDIAQDHRRQDHSTQDYGSQQHDAAGIADEDPQGSAGQAGAGHVDTEQEPADLSGDEEHAEDAQDAEPTLPTESPEHRGQHHQAQASSEEDVAALAEESSTAHREFSDDRLRQGATSSAAAGDTPDTRERKHQLGRAGAVVLGLAVVAVGIGSASADLSGSDTEQQPGMPAHHVMAPTVTERHVCPPVPGEPDSLSEQGELDYASRDEAVEASAEALIVNGEPGTTPSSDWVSVTEEGREDPELVTEAEAGEGESTPTLAERELLTSSQDLSGESPDPDSPRALELQPIDELNADEAPAATANFTYSSTDGPVTGLATAECQSPQRSQWFLGPETGGGANSLLTLTNPAERDATVDVSTYTREGATDDLGSTTLLVPAGSVRTVNMASLVDDDEEIAVHVQASGAPVTGQMQSSLAEGSAGGGSEILTGQAEPRQEHHMLAAPAGNEDAQLWIYVPGDEQASVELQAFDEDGQAPLDTPGVFTVEAGQLSVVNLEGLEAGAYDVVVASDEASVAAVRSGGDGQPISVDGEAGVDPITGEETAGDDEVDPPDDFSWTAAAEPLREGHGTVVPSSGETDLRLLTPADEETTEASHVNYRLVDSEGETSEEQSTAIDPGASLRISDDELAEQAEESGLEDVHSLVVTSVAGEAYAGTLTQDADAGFTIGQLSSIAPDDQYVPLRLQR